MPNARTEDKGTLLPYLWAQAYQIFVELFEVQKRFSLAMLASSLPGWIVPGSSSGELLDNLII